MVRVTIPGAAFQVLDDGRDPNSIEAHVLDIIQLVDDALPRPAAVLAVTSVASGR